MRPLLSAFKRFTLHTLISLCLNTGESPTVSLANISFVCPTDVVYSTIPCRSYGERVPPNHRRKRKKNRYSRREYVTKFWNNGHRFMTRFLCRIFLSVCVRCSSERISNVVYSSVLIEFVSGETSFVAVLVSSRHIFAARHDQLGINADGKSRCESHAYPPKKNKAVNTPISREPSHRTIMYAANLK